MRPFREIPKPRLQPSCSTLSSRSEHFHYESGPESLPNDSSHSPTPPSKTSISEQLSQNHHNGLRKQLSITQQAQKDDLGCIYEHTLEEVDEDELGFAPGIEVGSQSEAGNSDFTFLQSQKQAITAQKSRFSRANHSQETSSDQYAVEEGSRGLDETFSYDASKLAKVGREHFQICETPKMPKEASVHRQAGKQKEKTKGEEQKGKSYLTFVKYDIGQVDFAEDTRRYPYRISRNAPRLRYWEGERTDPINQGYWKRNH